MTIMENGFKFIPYQRFILQINAEENKRSFYSNRYCRRYSAFKEAARLSMLKGITVIVHDTKNQCVLKNPIELPGFMVHGKLELAIE